MTKKFIFNWQNVQTIFIDESAKTTIFVLVLFFNSFLAHLGNPVSTLAHLTLYVREKLRVWKEGLKLIFYNIIVVVTLLLTLIYFLSSLKLSSQNEQNTNTTSKPTENKHISWTKIHFFKKKWDSAHLPSVALLRCFHVILLV